MKLLPNTAGMLLTALGHVCGVAAIALGLALAMMPADFALEVIKTTVGDEQLLEMSSTAFVLHVGLSATIWAFLFIAFCYVRVRRRELANDERRVVRLARGSVMTETLVILPLFFVLTFGTAQMVINNIAGALCNVAAFEAGRAAWIWKPEADASRMGTDEDKATDMARIAAAMVMTPVAPGDFFGNGWISSEDARHMRHALALTHIPIFGYLLPEAATNLLALTQFADPIASEGNRYFSRALDESAFVIRTIKKFTHAYHVTEVEIAEQDGRLGVNLTYYHHIAMPLVGRIFGNDGLHLGFDSSLRTGRYAKYERFYGFRTQINTPNPSLPAGPFVGSPPSEPSIEGSIRGETGFND